jgi:hypothetical protein
MAIDVKDVEGLGLKLGDRVEIIYQEQKLISGLENVGAIMGYFHDLDPEYITISRQKDVSTVRSCMHDALYGEIGSYKLEDIIKVEKI